MKKIKLVFAVFLYLVILGSAVVYGENIGNWLEKEKAPEQTEGEEARLCGGLWTNLLN